MLITIFKKKKTFLKKVSTQEACPDLSQKTKFCLLWRILIFHRKNYLDLHISKSGLCFKEAGASILYTINILVEGAGI
jgi:hypothetical protein